MADRRYPRWLWALVAIPPLAAVLTALLAPEPRGHWSEHLQAVGMKSAQLVLLFVLAMLLGWRALGVLLLILLAAVAAGIVFQVIGDYQVAHSIWRTAGNPGDGIGYADGHDTSGFGDQIVLVSGLAVAIAVGVMRRVPPLLAVVAGVMVIIPPPFLWPAAGVLVLLLYGLTSPSRFESAKPLLRQLSPL